MSLAECHYAECHNAKCHYAECRYAECRGALICEISINTTQQKRHRAKQQHPRAKIYSVILLFIFNLINHTQNNYKILGILSLLIFALTSVVVDLLAIF
jgi:hypothetical protein